MFSVSKCCCCCSLKYGVYTVALINLVTRFCGGFGIWLSSPSVGSDGTYYIASLSTHIGFGSLSGWLIVTTFVVFAAMMGIAQKKPMLIYPYIVILIMELIIMDVSYLAMSIIASPFYLINIVLATAINGYYLICIISLYREIKKFRKHTQQLTEAVPYMKV